MDDAARPAGKLAGRISGLRWEAERCPEARWSDAPTPAAVGALIGFAAALFGRAPGSLRLIGAAAGAAVGALASQYHLNLDWDPDRLRGEPLPEPDAPRPEERPAPPPQPL